jgi:murein DD-endopeptidase MepM/ murein hydrolase activator NlpD
MSGIAVAQGKRVRRGELLGFVGCGSNGATHLHLALMKGNPERYLKNSYPFDRDKTPSFACPRGPKELG